jgi:hypothetical protein
MQYERHLSTLVYRQKLLEAGGRLSPSFSIPPIINHPQSSPQTAEHDTRDPRQTTHAVYCAGRLASLDVYSSSLGYLILVL